MMKKILRILLALVLVCLVWVAVSANPFAQGIKELLGSKPDQLVLQKQFIVPPHGFRYYTFNLPHDSKDVMVVGHFAATVSSQDGNPASGEIEVYVFNESSFADWLKGSNMSPIYGSGKAAQARLSSNLPDGSGVYYLVFSNKFDPVAAKNVSATALLRYHSWLPDWLRTKRG